MYKAESEPQVAKQYTVFSLTRKKQKTIQFFVILLLRNKISLAIRAQGGCLGTKSRRKT